MANHHRCITYRSREQNGHNWKITIVLITGSIYVPEISLTSSGNDLIEGYFNLGYTYPEIVAFLCLVHGITIRWAFLIMQF